MKGIFNKHFFAVAILMIACVRLSFAQVNIDPSTKSFAKEGGGASILTSGSGNWTATCNAPWVTISPRTSGTAGQSCVYVVAENTTASSRQGIITLADKTHTVSQAGYVAAISPTTSDFGRSGGNGMIAISVLPGMSWAAESSASWVTVSPSSGSGSGNVSYIVENYGNVTSRSAQLTIAGQIFTVNQSGPDVTLLPTSSEKPNTSDSLQVVVTALSNTSWSVTPAASWISVLNAGTGRGSSTVTLGLAENPGYLDRIGTVSIGSALVSVRQSGSTNPSLDISPNQAMIDHAGGAGTIAVSATPDGPWSAESLSPWISISGPTSGSGNGSITYGVSPNSDLSTRTGQIRFYPPVYQSRVDLAKMLLIHVPFGYRDVTGWQRDLNGSLDDRFDGTFFRTPSGEMLVDSGNATSVALRFKVENTGTIHRLFRYQAPSGLTTSVFVNSENKIAYQSGNTTAVSDYTVAAGQNYHVLVTANADKVINLYAGVVGGEPINIKTTQQTSWPFDFGSGVSPSQFRIGYSELPTPGYLSGALIQDFRVYGRDLSLDEAKYLFANALTNNQYGPSNSSLTVAPILSFKLDGNILVYGNHTNGLVFAQNAEKLESIKLGGGFNLRWTPKIGPVVKR